MTKRYEVPCVEGWIDWACVPVAAADTPLWGTDYCPRNSFQCVYRKEEALYIRMRCAEADPTARNFDPDSPVWEDSCMECFLSFGGGTYLNLEVNSNGALVCGYGSSRHGRRAVAEMDCPRPEVYAARRGVDGWEVVLRVLAETVSALWEGARLVSGTAASGNFYKCGDKTPRPHYLSWNPIELPAPNFHAPEFFGELIFR